jgi:hypothetical protein
MARGALAGMAGGAALWVTERLGRATVLPAGTPAGGHAEQAVRFVAQERGADLGGAAAAAAGLGVQLAYCAILGAAYGTLRRRVELPAVADALLLAGVAYVAALSGGGIVPRLGVAPPPLEQDLGTTAVDFGAHLAFGIATASAYEAA